MYNKLVLSGGAKRGILTLGALDYIYDKYPEHVSNIDTYIGCSVGAIFSYLLILGYKPCDILIKLITKEFFCKYKHIDFLKLSKCEGAYDWNLSGDLLRYLTNDKYNREFTLKELYEEFGKKLVCITYNYTKQEEEVLSYETHPDLSCIDALHMSSCIPLLFERFEYKSNHYIDGAIINNFPINLLEEDDKALAINCTKIYLNDDKNINISTFLNHMSSLVIINNVKNNLKNHKLNNTNIINIDGKDISTNGMSGNNIDILNIYSYGFKYTSLMYPKLLE